MSRRRGSHYEDDIYYYDRDRRGSTGGKRYEKYDRVAEGEDEEEIVEEEEHDIEYSRRRGPRPSRRHRSTQDLVRESLNVRVDKNEVDVDALMRVPRDRDDIGFRRRNRLREDGRKGNSEELVIRREREDRGRRDRSRSRRLESEQVIYREEKDRGQSHRDRDRDRDWETEQLEIRRDRGGIRIRELSRPRRVEDEEIVLTEDKIRDRGYRHRRRPDVREVEREEVIYATSPRDDVLFHEEEVSRRRRQRERDVEREDVIALHERVGRRRDPPSREDIIFRNTEMDWERRREGDREGDEIILRMGDKGSPRREELIIRDGEGGRRRPRGRESDREELIYRRGNRDSDREEIIIAGGDKRRSRHRERDLDEDELVVRLSDRSLPPRKDDQDEEVIIRRHERSVPDRRDSVSSRAESDEVILRRSEQDEYSKRERGDAEIDEFRFESRIRSRSLDRKGEQEEITIKQDEREERRRGVAKKEEITFRRQREESLLDSESSGTWSPEVVEPRRYIDHEYEKAASPRPRKVDFEEVDIHHRDERKGRSYENDIIIKRREDEIEARRPALDRLHDDSGITVIEKDLVVRDRGVDGREEINIRKEADFHVNRDAENTYTRDTHHGATKDWGVVVVPPGTKQVTMDGIDGAKEEISWGGSNGRRRSRIHIDDERTGKHDIAEEGQIGRRYAGVKDKRDRMWTEITKDLVVREALERSGYEFEETDSYYYVFEYLRYDNIAALVELSEDIRAARRERIREIREEREILHVIADSPGPPSTVPESERVQLTIERPISRPVPWETDWVREREQAVVFEETKTRR